MKLINSSFEILEQAPGIQGVKKQIELAGRACYKSENKISDTSCEEFVNRMINNQHCYVGNNEVLTENGWVKWANYNNEKLAVINPDLSFKGYEHPIRVIKQEYTGIFYEFPHLGLKVTDGHKMFGVFRNSKNNFYSDNNYQLFNCNTQFIDNNGKTKTLGERMFKAPSSCSRPLVTEPFYELVGFWLGDGSHCDSTNNLYFHLKKERKISYLQQLCSNLNYKLEVLKNDKYKVNFPNIGRIFNNLYYNNGKCINDILPPIHIHSILQGLINSDGSKSTKTKTISYTTTSKSIYEWITRFGAIAGYNITDCGISHYTNNNNPVYKLMFKDTQYIINNDSRKKKQKVNITKDTLPVYCATVSTGLLLVRGCNNQTSICGNCAMLEHGTVYLYLPIDDNNFSKLMEKYTENKYTVVNQKQFVTTNYRVLVENGWLDDLQYQCEPTEHHEKRFTVKFVLPISISREFIRHRTASFAEQSTRYCNYSKSKFNGELTFIKPYWYDQHEKAFESSCQYYEDIYMMSTESGLKAQEAREFLPLCTKTELVMTAFVSDWEHFFQLRCHSAAHPQARELAVPLKEEFIKRGYIGYEIERS